MVVDDWLVDVCGCGCKCIAKRVSSNDTKERNESKQEATVNLSYTCIYISFVLLQWPFFHCSEPVSLTSSSVSRLNSSYLASSLCRLVFFFFYVVRHMYIPEPDIQKNPYLGTPSSPFLYITARLKHAGP